MSVIDAARSALALLGLGVRARPTPPFWRSLETAIIDLAPDIAWC